MLQLKREHPKFKPSIMIQLQLLYVQLHTTLVFRNIPTICWRRVMPIAGGRTGINITKPRDP